jgi:putative inorganic carbon (HCO3(-)) transporter
VSDPTSPHGSVASQSEKVKAVSPVVWEKIRRAIWTIECYGLVLITFMSFFPGLIHLEEGLFVTLLVIALGTAWREGRTMWVRTPVDLPLLLFIGWVLLSIPFATDPAYSFIEWRKVVTRVLVFYWALLILRVQTDEVMIRRILTAVVIGTALLCGYALIDFFGRGGTWQDRYIRAGAPSSDYNWLSTYIVIVIPFLVAVAVSSSSSWLRMFSICVAGLALLAQVLSYTRAGWIGMVTQGFSFGLLTASRKLILWILGGCLIGGIGLVALSQTGYQRQTASTDNFEYRRVLWERGIQEIASHPIVGVGYGDDTFFKRFGGHPKTGHPAGLHSTFLMVAMGSGIPAVAFLLWTLLGAVLNLLPKKRTRSDWIASATMAATAIMIIGFAVRNLFDYMFAGSLAYLFWILVAVGLALRASLNPLQPGIKQDT